MEKRHGVRAHARLQRQGRGVEQRLLAVDRSRPLRGRRPAGQRRHRASRLGRGDSVGCAGPDGILLAIDIEKSLADEEMKVPRRGDGRAGAHHEADGSRSGLRRVHRRDPDRAHRRLVDSRMRSRPPSRQTPTCTTRTATSTSPTTASRSAWCRSLRAPRGSRSTTTTTFAGRGRSRATTSPHARRARSTSTSGAERCGRAAGAAPGEPDLHDRPRPGRGRPVDGRGDLGATRRPTCPTRRCSSSTAPHSRSAGELQTQARRARIRRGGRHRRRPDARRREVRRHAGRNADGRGGDEPGP